MSSPFGLENPLELFLKKSRNEFTRGDLLRVIEGMAIEFLSFHYTGLEGKLKELRLPVQNRGQVMELLAEGERADGSSLFKGLVETACSDLYVVPVYRTAFLNPFSKKTLGIMCRFFDRDGNLATFAPGAILHEASKLLKTSSGLSLYALGELEFFLLYRPDTEDGDHYPLSKQSGYHATGPFVKNGAIVEEMVRHIARITGSVKYAHSEVGVIRDLVSNIPEINGRFGEQWEIEFLPAPVEDMADDLVIAKWIVRNVAQEHGCIATFAPKLEEGVAGNGFHFHMMLKDGDENVMVEKNGDLSTKARQLIGGVCHYADSLTAFGNTVSSAYLRLVPGQEAPTRVCWSDLNRTAMIRVPLGWQTVHELAASLNPRDEKDETPGKSRQTVELRTADGSALIHLILSGITMAAQWGLSHPEESMRIAENLYLPMNNFREKDSLDDLPPLPRSCVESAAALQKRAELYTREGIFPESVLQYMAELLRAEDDEDMNQRLTNMPADQRLNESLKIMHGNLHRH
ncbi:MAG: glutamine synthetase [Acidobacteria bacterium CG_4_9_14_3_um_filter_49_7]|nr:MAG: glutamine synthetase [Acidobacteria bacterium CG_4_9_14_3_um_filter_49_7]